MPIICNTIYSATCKQTGHNILILSVLYEGKGKAVLLKAWSDPKGSGS